jgi:DNA-binding response OmpR family regulator
MSDKHILVVDDDLAIVEILEMILDEEGYDVSRAYTGQESLVVAKQRKPDLILLDLMLPDMHGSVVAHHIRSEPALKDIPILVVSASKDMQDIVRAMDIQGAIAKPFELDALLSSVESQLSA